MAITTAGRPARRPESLLVQTDWNGYRRLGDLLTDRRIRLNFDQGQLEIITVGTEHEHLADLLKSLLQAYLTHGDRAYIMEGSTTFRRREKQKGFEPDGCFWLATARRMVGVKKWNAQLHPPPDVAVEVTITHALLDRLAIFAAVGVPEVWWYHDGRVEVLLLSEQGEYHTVLDSPAFPGLPPAVIADHLAISERCMDSEILASFRSWLKGQPW